MNTLTFALDSTVDDWARLDRELIRRREKRAYSNATLPHLAVTVWNAEAIQQGSYQQRLVELCLSGGESLLVSTNLFSTRDYLPAFPSIRPQRQE